MPNEARIDKLRRETDDFMRTISDFVTPSSLDISHSSLIILSGNNKSGKARLVLKLNNGPSPLSPYQRAMDESGARFVHGRRERRRCVEAFVDRCHSGRAHL